MAFFLDELDLSESRKEALKAREKSAGIIVLGPMIVFNGVAQSMGLSRDPIVFGIGLFFCIGGVAFAYGPSRLRILLPNFGTLAALIYGYFLGGGGLFKFLGILGSFCMLIAGMYLGRADYEAEFGLGLPSEND